MRRAEDFKRILSVDYEFYGANGERPTPVSCAIRDIRTGEVQRVWYDQFGTTPPFDTSPDTLVVTFFGSAEWNCHLALGW